MTIKEWIATAVAALALGFGVFQYTQRQAEVRGSQQQLILQLSGQVTKLENAVDSLEKNLAGLERWLVDLHQREER